MRRRLLWRQATSSLGTSLALALIVAISAGVFTAWPRLHTATFVNEINYQIDQAPVTSRALRAQVEHWNEYGPLNPPALKDALAAVMSEAGDALTESAGPARFSITSVDALPLGGATYVRPADLVATGVRLRVDPDVEPFVRVSAGAFPAPSPLDPLLASLTTEADLEAFEDTTWPSTEVMLSTETAARLGLSVGQEFTIPALGLFTSAEIPLVLSGTFEPVDPGADQWEFELNTITPQIIDDPNAGVAAYGTAYVNSTSIDWLSWFGPGTVAQFWIPIQATTTNTAGLAADLREFTSAEHEIAPFGGADLTTRLRFDSALSGVLETALSRQLGTRAILTMVAAGPAGVTLAVLALGARMAISRRRSTLALASARGGSPRQIRGALAGEGVILGVPAAVVGAGAATALVRATSSPSDYVLPAVIALAPAVFLATATLPSLRAARTDLSLTPSRTQARTRWVIEVVVVALAAIAVYLLLGRGLAATARGSVDPIASGAPLLLALAGSVLALRLYPLPLALAHRVTKARRGLIGFLGSARATREGSAALVPMLALIVGVAIAIFSTTMITTLRGGVYESAVREVGADVRLVGPYFTPDVMDRARAVPGVAAVADVGDLPNTPLAEDEQFRRLTLYAVDTQALRQVQAGVPGAVVLPPGMHELTPEGRIPILVSAGHEVDAAAELELIFSQGVPVELVGQPESASGVSSEPSWALVDVALLREATGSALLARLLLVDLAAPANAGQVSAAQEALAQIIEGSGTITAPAQGVSEFRQSPSAASMERGFVLALAASFALSVVAVVMSLVLAAPARGRLLAVLRTLGLEPRDARRLVAWETTPLAVVALVVGVALGLVLPLLVAAAVDLRPFTGSDTQPALRYEPLLLLGVVGALGLVLAGCIALATAIARRLSLSVLRIGDPS